MIFCFDDDHRVNWKDPLEEKKWGDEELRFPGTMEQHSLASSKPILEDSSTSVCTEAVAENGSA